MCVPVCFILIERGPTVSQGKPYTYGPPISLPDARITGKYCVAKIPSQGEIWFK